MSYYNVNTHPVGRVTKMGYIENNLVKGEEIIFVTKLHWWAIVGQAIRYFVVILILGLLIGGSGTSNTTGRFVGNSRRSVLWFPGCSSRLHQS